MIKSPLRLSAILAWFLLGIMLCQCRGSAQPLIVFYAPTFSPLMAAWHSTTPGIKLATELAGSQMLCRMITDGGREADVVMLADAELFKKLASARCHWRIEFSHDELVLGIGIRAPAIDTAEKDWARVLAGDTPLVLGRVNESLGPVGYRTLLAWKLLELNHHPGIYQKLVDRTSRLSDHADHLAALLKNGDVDYGFLYKTSCLQYDIRFIHLSDDINMGKAGINYARASITYTTLKQGQKIEQYVSGRLITYGISIPDNAPHPEQARRWISELLQQQELFQIKGYQAIKPKFFGNRRDYLPFQAICEYGGDF